MSYVNIGHYLVSSFPAPRWNFSKANWAKFKKECDDNIRWIEPIISNYERFVNMVIAVASKSIPRGFRKEYVPGWSDACSTLYNEFVQSNDPEIADNLLSLLDSIKKEKWHKSMESLDFTHSSRKSWNTLKKLGSSAPIYKKTYSCSVNEIASRLVSMSKVSMDKNFCKEIKQNLKRKIFQCPVFANEFDYDFTLDEINIAIKSMKQGKAAGVDGIFNEFIINSGEKIRNWLAQFFSNMLRNGKIPPIFSKAKILAILKPGKNGDNAADFRPISLLCVCYKLLERLIFNRISDKIYQIVPVTQAGFRPGRNCCDQVLSLTTFIEIGFQNKRKTGTAFVDLSAAYDTVWRHGLLMKLIDIIPSKSIIGLLNNMLANRWIQVFVNGKKSRSRRLNDGLPQGSILAPLLFILYISDLPVTNSEKFIYADDITLASQHESFEMIEQDLRSDLQILWSYFKKWRLRPNISKTEVSVHHLNNQLANKTLNVCIDGSQIKHNQHPKYLGITLDRSLTYNIHLEGVKRKIKSRVNIISKLAGSSWGASVDTLRISALSLVYSVAEYCCPVWMNSHHTSKVDVELNKCMRIISGSVSSTPISWLPILSNIAPPSLRRENTSFHQWKKIGLNSDLPLFNLMNNLPPNRLTSRSPSYGSGLRYFNGENFDLCEKWKVLWSAENVQNAFLVADPNVALPGMQLSRRLWITLNRFRTGHGRCAYMLFKWNLLSSPVCDCGHNEQTMLHIVNDCHLRKFFGGLDELSGLSSDALVWLNNLDLFL